MGLFLVFLGPPGYVPDEPSHFIRANQIIDMDINAISNFPLSPFNRNSNSFFNRNDSIEIFSIPAFLNLLGRENNQFNTIEISGTTSRYHLINYFPQCIGLALGKLIGLNYFSQFILGRLASLIIYVCIGYWILKTTPVAKRTLFIFLSLPMSVFLAASYSADAILIPSLNE